MPVINCFIDMVIFNWLVTTHFVEFIKAVIGWDVHWVVGLWLSAIESASPENWTKISR